VGREPGSSQFHFFSHFHHSTTEPQRLPMDTFLSLQFLSLQFDRRHFGSRQFNVAPKFRHLVQEVSSTLLCRWC
jgi:hypothetical protein